MEAAKHAVKQLKKGGFTIRAAAIGEEQLFLPYITAKR